MFRMPVCVEVDDVASPAALPPARPAKLAALRRGGGPHPLADVLAELLPAYGLTLEATGASPPPTPARPR